jgi:acyl dehydratase
MSAGKLLEAFLRRRPGIGPSSAGGVPTIPAIEVSRTGVRVPADVLAKYRRLCAFADDGRLPLTFPQMLAGDLHVRLLADARFPLPVAGIVHFENRIVEHEPLAPEDTFDLVARVEGHRDDRRGFLFDIETEARRGGRVVWTATTTVLSRPKSSTRDARPKETRAARETPGLSEPPLRSAVFALPADLGRRYSVLAGDYNPIHLYPITARPFGFKRPIIHGMYTLARCLAEAADDLPPAPRICTIRFERPVFLPGRAHLAVTALGPSVDGNAGAGVALTLTSPDLRTRHFSAEVRTLGRPQDDDHGGA